MIDLYWFIQGLDYAVCLIREGQKNQLSTIVVNKKIAECKTGNEYDLSMMGIQKEIKLSNIYFKF